MSGSTLNLFYSPTRSIKIELLFFLASLVSFGRAIFLGLIGARIHLENITRSDMTTLRKLVSWHNVKIVFLVSAVTFGFLSYYPPF